MILIISKHDFFIIVNVIFIILNVIDILIFIEMYHFNYVLAINCEFDGTIFESHKKLITSRSCQQF